MAWKNEKVDYTGARAHDYIDSYTNRPEDMGSIEGLQNLLSGAGMLPGVGEPADLLNALIYGVKGQKGEALSSMLSMIPFLGGAVKPFTKAIKPLRAGKETAEQAAKRKKYWGMKKQERGGYHLDEYGDDAYRLEKEYRPTGKKEGDFFKSLLDSFFD